MFNKIFSSVKSVNLVLNIDNNPPPRFFNLPSFPYFLEMTKYKSEIILLGDNKNDFEFLFVFRWRID